MNNTYTLYDTVVTFQRRQREAYDAYIEAMKGLESAKGSQYYDDRQKEAMSKRKAAEEEARKEARYWLKKTVDEMAAANHVRKAIPPTADQLAVLQAMKMRTDISDDELEQIANAMEGNSMGLGIVNDFAREVYSRREKGTNAANPHPHGFPKNYLSMARDSYPVKDMDQEIRNIASACSQIIESDGANRIRGMTTDIHNKQYGTTVDRDTLAREAIPTSESAFYENLSSVPVNILQNCLNS